MKLFGIWDIFIGAILIFNGGPSMSWKILVFLAIVMIAKSSIGFWKDFGSWIDLIIGFVFLLIIVVTIPKFIGIILGILIIQKGVVSFL